MVTLQEIEEFTPDVNTDSDDGSFLEDPVQSLKRATSLSIADAFLKNFICRFGAPKSLLTDQGSNFLSSLMKNVNTSLLFLFSMLILLYCVLLSCGMSRSLMGFDCGGPHMNITTVSLLGTGDCDLKTKDIKTQNIHIQLLQLTDFEFTPYIQCRVSVSRTVSHCGMHSHISAVHNGQAEYLRDVPYQQCERMHRDGILSLSNGNTIDNLRSNTTTTRSVLMAGSVSNDGSCEGASYSDPYGSWDKVIVQAIIKITLKSGFVPVKTNTGKVTLRSGTICTLSEGSCLDIEDGYTFWQIIPSATCNFKQYDVLYEGIAQKTREENVPNTPEIYSLVTQDTTFALARTTEIKICGFTLLRTEHPKLFIMETQPGNSFTQARPVSVENLDIFTYVNSKFVYVEKHIRTQINAMYKDIMLQKCELEQQVIKNALALAYNQPEEFAYMIMKGPGYIAVTAGEAIHIIKCIPVEVTLRPTQECYNELPVVFKNDSYFLHPKSHVLKKIGTNRECNRLLPVLYQIDENWIRFLPKPIDAPAPTILKPRTALTWKYMSPGKLATSGIYSQKDIDNLREHIMFPAEKPAMINNVVQGITGKQPLGDGMSVYNLMDEKTLDKITTGAARKLWNGFISFGSASAGLLAIFVIIRLIKIILDTLIHGYALHSVYGCGIQLFGAIWSSVTHLLLHLAKPARPRQSPKDAEAQEEANAPVIEMQPLPSTSAPTKPSAMYLELRKKLQDV